MSSVKCNDSLRDTVTLTPKILERMFYNHILRIRIKGRKKKRKQEEKEEKRKKKMKEEGIRRRKRWSSDFKVIPMARDLGQCCGVG